VKTSVKTFENAGIPSCNKYLDRPLFFSVNCEQSCEQDSNFRVVSHLRPYPALTKINVKILAHFTEVDGTSDVCIFSVSR